MVYRGSQTIVSKGDNRTKLMIFFPEELSLVFIKFKMMTVYNDL